MKQLTLLSWKTNVWNYTDMESQRLIGRQEQLDVASAPQAGADAALALLQSQQWQT